jgi:hypothetical protein
MNQLPTFLPLMLAAPLMLLNVVWSVAVIVFLYKIWQRVKRLPG